MKETTTTPNSNLKRINVSAAPESVPVDMPSNAMEKTQRKRWQNYVSNQIVEALQYCRPTTLQHLIDIMHTAAQQRCRVKAVGSGHSFSDIVQTTDILVDTHGLNRPIALDENLLYDQATLAANGYRLHHLVHVESGIRIRDLNNYLDSKNLALQNMGGYDAQTLAGVVSTSTHGTGITLGPIADDVVSVVLVGEKGCLYRIEPANGITHPDKYKEAFPQSRLIQDDDVFHAVLVSMGCMGIMYSLIVQVRDSFFLQEERVAIAEERCWEDLRENNRILTLLKNNRHLEIWVNPYATGGKHNCLVTKRNEYKGNVTRLPKKSRMRRWFIEKVMLRYFTGLPEKLFTWLHKKTPQLINASLNGVLDRDGYTDKSFKVMNLGNANNVRGYAAEYAVSLQHNLFIEAVEKILEVAAKNRELGQVYHTAPISLRFVKQSRAHLSMMHGEDKCLIEVPLVYQTKGRFQILDKLEDELFALGSIRPHWGQYHNLGKDAIRELYPALDKWLAVYRQMNQTGVFCNTFTDRCGFS